MGLHKLSAGDGYTYLTRQVAVQDASDLGRGGLAEYYAQHGESPGVWLGRGGAGLDGFDAVGQVSEAQMVALFGQGRHPDAARLEAAVRAAGGEDAAVREATRLGAAFAVRSGVTPFRRDLSARYAAWAVQEGLPAGSAVPEKVRAQIRTELATERFALEYGRAPRDARELSGFLAKLSASPRTPVAGYDLTFTPVKSVSVLWALAPHEMAEVIEQAHDAAVRDVLTWLEDNAACTRSGREAVRQVEVVGLIAAGFTHRDSRAGDPNLHTHVAVSNKVQTLDGRWLALDARPLHQLTVAASERYNTRLEALLRDRLGVRFVDQPAPAGKRPVREIVGVDPRLLSVWSSRRADIDAARAVLARQFQQDHGRPPTPVEAIRLAQQATLATRPDKHGLRSHHQQRTAWHVEAVDTLGDDTAVDAILLAAVPQPQPAPPRLPARSEGPVASLTGPGLAAAADAVLDRVQGTRATWQVAHVRAEAERHVRALELPAVELDVAVDRLVAAVLAPGRSVALHEDGMTGEQEAAAAVPAALRRRDGTSVYVGLGTRRYTSTAVLRAEQSLLDAAGRNDGRTISTSAVDLALLEAAANGRPLNLGQAELVRQLACSGTLLQLALAPAGTGKTTALGVLARTWTDSGGTVLGLAPSAAAAAVLREDLSSAGTTVVTDTLAKLLSCLPAARATAGTHDHSRPDPSARSVTPAGVTPARGLLSSVTPAARLGVTQERNVPDWVHQVGPGTLVLLDEAGMAGTLELAHAVEFVLGRGGSVRLVGDDQQLASITAGGVLRDLADARGAVSLSDVVRFTDPVEGEASLKLREGDPLALGFYLDRDRIHVGDPATSQDLAYTAWQQDRAAGLDSVLLAPTRDVASSLNARARADRLRDAPPGGAAVHLSDGTKASAGDTILTRRNDRRLRLSGTDWVKNGDRWHVDHVDEHGRLHVRHLRHGLQAVLPASYVAEHATLGYASTIHTAQGSTADTSHTVLTGNETRQLLYVAATRGRTANHLYLATVGDGDEHSPLTPDALHPPTAGDLLGRILRRDGAAISATTTRQQLTDPAVRLGATIDRFLDGLQLAAEHHLGADGLAGLDQTAEHLLPGLTGQDAYPTLRAHLALLALDGYPLERLLRLAIDERELLTADDLAAVLHRRLPSPAGGPLAWLPAIPAALANDPTWDGYLLRQDQQIRQLAETVAEQSRDCPPQDRPLWAQALPDATPEVLAQLAVFRGAQHVDEDDLTPTGPPQLHAQPRRAQRVLENAAAHSGAPSRGNGRAFDELADRLDPRLTNDPHWRLVTQTVQRSENDGGAALTVLEAALDSRPLPDELPAAALYWRLAAARTADDSDDLARHDRARAGLPSYPVTPSPSAGLSHDQWHDLAARLDPRLVTDRGWVTLAAAFDRAEDAGYPVAEHLPRLAHEPLPERHPARALHLRLVDECPAAVTPLPRPQLVAPEAAARSTPAQGAAMPSLNSPSRGPRRG